MIDCITQYYRCPKTDVQFATQAPLGRGTGFFHFGTDITCYGNYCGARPTDHYTGALQDVLNDAEIKNGTVYLPFDPSQIAENLRHETYVEDWRSEISLSAEIYYFLRPLLPVVLRRHLQKLYLSGWEKIPFPHWPVDSSVDDLLGQLMLLAIRSAEVRQVPFIWFWPDGAPSSAIMTHDVETTAGRDFCATLMDIDESFGIRASFSVIPEERYAVERGFVSSIRDRGFEVVVHDLNHDGHLYRTREQFLARAAKINAYGKKYGAEGFRAGALYRKQVWYDALDFAYDSSVPNVAHLDPQHGGCCTVMPYFIGKVLELPVTTIQDYTLFNILGDYSTALWKRQIALIMAKHGLMSFIVHPDYISETKERGVYEELLSHLAHLRTERGIWIALPCDVNRWWRQRSQMRLVEDGDGWRIVGEGAERACIAYASEENGRLILTMQETSAVAHLPGKPIGVTEF